MGFRFSRRIGILPGLNLNFSGSGVSLSAGVRGAHINFGSRGTYTTVGIPGTGLSYRQRIGGGRSYSAARTLTQDQVTSVGNRENDETALKLFREGSQTVSMKPDEARRYVADPRFKLTNPRTGRRITPERLEAIIKADDLKEKIDQLQVQLQTEAEEYQHLLNFWKPLPAIATVDEWKAAMEMRPFESHLPPPMQPNIEQEQARLMNELTSKHETGLNKLLPGFVARNEAKAEFTTAWPERENQFQQQYTERYQQYEQQLAQDQSAWEQAEAKRIDWVKRLLAGDLEEINHTIAEVLTGLQLPFKAQCDYFLEDNHSVCLHVDLPEMEEVIPETTKEILKNGNTREKRRTKQERESDYTQLVIGYCVFLAAELFSYLPLAQEVKLAAYTQRPRIKETDPVDSYVLDVTLNRDVVKEFDGANLTAFMVRSAARFDVNSDGGLNRIEPPSWLQHKDYRHLQAC